jgi:hypothetical protein
MTTRRTTTTPVRTGEQRRPREVWIGKKPAGMSNRTADENNNMGPFTTLRETVIRNERAKNKDIGKAQYAGGWAATNARRADAERLELSKHTLETLAALEDETGIRLIAAAAQGKTRSTAAGIDAARKAKNARRRAKAAAARRAAKAMDKKLAANEERAAKSGRKTVR